MACRAHLGEVQGHYDEIQQIPAEVLVVSFSPPHVLAKYLQLHPFPFPILSDPALEAYQAFGLGRTSWKAILSPRVLGKYLGLLFRGWLPRKTNPSEDVLQLGGDFVLDPDLRVVYAYPSQDPSDRPPVADLLHAARRALAD